MRDIISLPLDTENSLIIASDNSGAIGMKEHDHVQVSYESVAYYSFRVAAMECMAAGGEPMSVILHNFCGNEPWEELLKGIQKGLTEIGMSKVPITGSSESNFALLQSAIGLVVLGKKTNAKVTELVFSSRIKFAVIGQPLVGTEVIEESEKIVPLTIFQEVCKMDEIMVWPVGSKGIFFEMNQMFSQVRFTLEMVSTEVDIFKSSGPATCFIVMYNSKQEERIKNLTGTYFHSLRVSNV
ncbi:ATP-binding protein [Paenibacillus sp. BSR1-1]|uniref:ATP-binding protein n=1 Tax=Paenibacillus sp. BSR1-1 TaxID=3020845 RepID=UPI0025B05D42|nr:ATP-binding protein [Paenibacillus sp. BSR1-1]MDN3015274.1 ATP-binding protein [Paenibacillus sp. BSR1-1]